MSRELVSRAAEFIISARVAPSSKGLLIFLAEARYLSGLIYFVRGLREPSDGGVGGGGLLSTPLVHPFLLPPKAREQIKSLLNLPS